MTKSHLPLAVGILCVAVGIVDTVTAQVSPRLAFEAASIKPNDSTSFGRRIGVPGDRFVATNDTLWRLITVAYGAPGVLPQPLNNYQLSGGPKWIDTDRFDVEAKATGDVVRGTEGTRRKQLMLQSLLAQRFKLAVHHEKRKMPVYALVFARRDRTPGPKLHRSQVDRAVAQGAPNNPAIPRPAFGTPACEAAGACSPGLSVVGLFKGAVMTMAQLTVYLSKWSLDLYSDPGAARAQAGIDQGSCGRPRHRLRREADGELNGRASQLRVIACELFPQKRKSLAHQVVPRVDCARGSRGDEPC